MPYVEKEDKHKIPLLLSFHYGHSKHKDKVDVNFRISLPLGYSPGKIIKEFTTYRGDSQEQAYKKFLRYIKNSFPRQLKKLINNGTIIPEE